MCIRDSLRTMQQINIEVASSFIVMAATLLLMKSRALLPREEPAEEEGLTEEEEPAVELARRLGITRKTLHQKLKHYDGQPP